MFSSTRKIFQGSSNGTDGVTWSPSRLLGNFLVCRELDKPFEPGGKKKVIKKCRRRPVQPGEPYPPPGGSGKSCSLTIGQSTNSLKPSTPSDYEQQLSLLLLIMSELCWGKLLAYRPFLVAHSRQVCIYLGSGSTAYCYLSN